MSKWKVEGITSRYYHAPRCWDVYDHNGMFWKSFDTHAEALACADRKARTREVVLPRVDDPTFIDEDDLDIIICRLDNLICIDQPSFRKPGENEVISMYPKVAEEVALALLSHAERMQK